MKKKETPGKSRVEDVASFLGSSADKLIKTLLYLADGEPAAVLLRGDHDANETKIKRQIGAKNLELAGDDMIRDITDAEVGFAGPVGLQNVTIYADHAVKALRNAITGANQEDMHLVNVNYERDFNVDKWIDAREIESCDPCPECGSEIEITDSIEVGHTFKLGTKYSKALEATFLDESGKEKPSIMGCYGIGVNRIIASLIENSHDENGIIWPVEVAPFEVAVLPLKMANEQIREAAEKLYGELSEEGIDVIIDDRDKSVGVKFKDADLVGFPVQVVIGSKGLKDNNFEIKLRRTGEREFVPVQEAVSTIKAKLKALVK